MAKDNFLDTNIIFNYSNYLGDSSKEIITKCYFFIKNKNGNFILCGAVLEELSNIIIKRSNIHKAVIKKLKDEKFSFESLLSERDVPFAKKIYEALKNQDIKKVSEELARERDLSEMYIQKFLKVQVDERVISIEQINNELVNKIHDIIQNHADCKILASALQIQTQEGRETFFFVTSDGKDLDPNGYEYLKEHFKTNYSKENYKFPELHNLMFVN